MAALWFSACDVQVNLGDGGAGGGGTFVTGGGSGGGGGDMSGHNDAGAGGGNAIELWCSASRACPSGQFCFNGLCAIGCQSNANCASDQYCATDGDMLCHNKVVPTCTVAGDCGEQQVCTSGFCSTPPPATQCNPDNVPSGNDGCDARSVCIDSSDTAMEDPQCHTFPACAADKTCPTGTQGAVCNDGLIPNKDKICLIGLCRDVGNCPANWACVKGVSTDVLGFCSSRGFGAPCSGAADCISGNCSQPVPGFLGWCQ